MANKYVIGSILFGILLLVIYGARASNRVASWVDGADPQAAESSAGQFVSDGRAQLVQAQQPNADLSPLEQAGELPQRQTFTNGGGDAVDFSTDPNVIESQSQTNIDPQPSAVEIETVAETLEDEPVVEPQPAVQALW